MSDIYKFENPTGMIIIDRTRCPECPTLACVKACSLYNGGIYRVQDHKPILKISFDEAKRGRCIECLACEEACRNKGFNVITIIMPMPELLKAEGER